MNYYITVGHVCPDNYQDVGPYESEEVAKAVLNALPEFKYYLNDDPEIMRDEWIANHAIGGSHGCILSLTTIPTNPAPADQLHTTIYA